jgi:hypothetical protein
MYMDKSGQNSQIFQSKNQKKHHFINETVINSEHDTAIFFNDNED